MEDEKVLKYPEETTSVEIYKNTGEGPQVLTLVSPESVTYCKKSFSGNTFMVMNTKQTEKFCLQRAGNAKLKWSMIAYPSIDIGIIGDHTLLLADGFHKKWVIQQRDSNGNCISTLDDNQVIVGEKLLHA